MDAILTILLNEITGFPERFAQILDDYQVIQSQPIHTAVQYFMEHMPPHMHLILSSRTDPPLPLGRLRARDQLNEIRSDDLRFTLDETATFINQSMGLALSTENVISLGVQTEGWIAGLQLAGLALKGRGLKPGVRRVSEFIESFTGSHRYIVSYLIEEVLSQLPKGTIDFLLQTSILDSLSGSLCDFVLGTSKAKRSDESKSSADSQSILEQLEHANLFIVPKDDEGIWYRYHQLFAEVLRLRLKQEMPERIAGLHLRASEWYEQSGSIPQAVRHALNAEEWERAGRLIQQNALSYGFRGQIHLVLSWLSALPEDIVRSYPLLCIFHAGALMHSNRLEDAEVRLRDAEESIRPDAPAAQRRLNLGWVSMHRSNLFRIQGDIRGCVEHSRQALDLLPETDIASRASAGLNLAYGFLSSGNVNLENEDLVTNALADVRAAGNEVAVLRGTTLMARLQALQGRLHGSRELYQEASMTFWGQDGTSLFIGTPTYFFGLGDLEREWNRLDESEKLLTQGVIQARQQIFDGDVMMQGYQSLARVKQARDDMQGARATLAEFTQLAEKHHFSETLIANVSAVNAWLSLLEDNIPAAVDWAETRGLETDHELSFARERETLTLARVYIRVGRKFSDNERLQKALQLLDRLLASAQTDGRVGSTIEILNLQAIAFQASGDLDQAQKSIEQALTLACPEGYIRTFVDEGEPMRLLITNFQRLTKIQSKEPDPISTYIDRLLAAFAGGTQTASPSGKRVIEDRMQKNLPMLTEHLSDRELAVLHLIASGASNAEIAETLFIALSTVKSHTVNLYGKLGVNSRTQAVVRAQQLGLL